MKSLIYDVITGAAIIMALFVVTKVMRANQKFIVTQSGAKTDNEQVYLDSESEAKENTYTAADVYGTFHTILENGNNSDDSSRWMVYDYTKFILKVPGVSYTVAYNDYSQAWLQAIENQLLTYLETSPNTQFIRKKDSSYDNAAKHKATIYEFQQKTGGALLPTEETPIIPVPDEIVVPVTPEDPGTPESPTEFDASQMYLQFKNIFLL